MIFGRLIQIQIEVKFTSLHLTSLHKANCFKTIQDQSQIVSKTIRMEEKDSIKITIPPLSIDEEGEEVIVDLNEVAGSEEKAPQEEVAESVDSTIKSIKPTEGLEKGVLQEDLFNTQRLLNGRNPSPKSVRQYLCS